HIYAHSHTEQEWLTIHSSRRRFAARLNSGVRPAPSSLATHGERSYVAETNAILAWTLVSECPVPGDVTDLLATGETAIAAYKTFRDAAIFTNKRLIVRDAQGFSGKKVEI